MTDVPSIDEAFDMVAQLAGEAQARSKLSYAASLKPMLANRLVGFDERALGFDTFRAFLRAAEAEGKIALTLAEGGDVEILPGGSTMPAERVQVRRDLWEAVIGRTEHKARYRPDIDRIVVGEADDSGLPLPQATDADQRGWADEFLIGLGGEEAVSVGRTMAELDAAGGDWREALRASPGIRRQWYGYRAKRVDQLLRAWAAENGVELRIRIPQRRQDKRPAARTSESRGATLNAETYERRVRERAHAAIDRMPLADLLRLEIPLGYTLDA